MTLEHQVVKPQKLANAAVELLEENLTIPKLFQRESIDQFKGAEDDTVSVRVEGVLPYHIYEWRSGSAGSSTPGTRQSIIFDEYAERKIPVTFGGNAYNAVRLTDEQNDMDLSGWQKLLTPQTKAVSRGLQREAVRTLTDAAYNVTIGDTAADHRGAFIEANRIFDAFHVPQGNRYMLVGSNYHASILNDPNLTLAQYVGDEQAGTVLHSAIVGQLFGFTVVKDQTLPADEAYAFADNGFIFLNAAPSVPQSVPFGATASFEGVSLRWLRDYDTERFQDRSVVNCYYGFRDVKDVLVGWDEANKTEVVSTSEYFVRGVKLLLDGASDYPAAAGELATLTGVSDADVWHGGVRKTEGDVSNV